MISRLVSETHFLRWIISCALWSYKIFNHLKTGTKIQSLVKSRNLGDIMPFEGKVLASAFDSKSGARSPTRLLGPVSSALNPDLHTYYKWMNCESWKLKRSIEAHFQVSHFRWHYITYFIKPWFVRDDSSSKRQIMLKV